MRDGVEGFLAAATGPTTLQMRLRRATRPVRRSGGALGAIRGVRTAFPRSVFGGELLGVLGERLRELIAPQAPLSEEEAELRALSRRRAAPGASERPRPGFDRHPWSSRRVDWGGAGSASAGRRFLRQSDVDAVSGRVPVGSHAAAPALAGAREPRPLAGAALLDDRLRRYRHDALAAELRGTGARPGVVPGARPSVSPSGPAPSAVSPPGARASMSEAELVRELSAFVADREGTAGAGEWLPRAADLPGADEYATRFERDAARSGATGREPVGRLPAESPRDNRRDGSWPEAGYRGAPLRDLADDMAEILREQAIRHGIDIA